MSGHFGEKITQHSVGVELRFLGRAACSLVAIPTEESRLTDHKGKAHIKSASDYKFVCTYNRIYGFECCRAEMPSSSVSFQPTSQEYLEGL
jgi:hypothetical protein